MSGPIAAGVAVLVVSLMAVLGPLLGLSPWITTALVALTLAALTVDAARFGGRGGHLVAEALPGGKARLRRIALHEAGHVLVAEREAVAVTAIHVGSLACLRAGLSSGGTTVLTPPDSARLPLEDLRRWSRVLLAGMAAETLVYGGSEGGGDDRSLLGRLWGVSGHDVDTAQREQRRARREVEQWLRAERSRLEAEADRLVESAPRLGWPRLDPTAGAASTRSVSGALPGTPAATASSSSSGA